MASSNDPQPPPPGPPALPRPQSQNRPPKPLTSPSNRRSLPVTSQQPFVYPVTPLCDFLPLAVAIKTPVDYTDRNRSPEYDAAMARLLDLVAESIITTNQSKLLGAAMSTAQNCFAARGEIHPLLETIASVVTPASDILGMVTIVDAGMRAFVAHPGPTAGPGTDVDGNAGSESVASSSASRSDAVKTACATRDNRTCIVTGAQTGECCHIIRYSVKGDKAKNFWAFVSMFKGPAATHQLKEMTLGRDPWNTDSIRNVIWLGLDTHKFFDKGELSIVPVMTSLQYDPATVSEVCSP